jgi:hypothetical protein
MLPSGAPKLTRVTSGLTNARGPSKRTYVRTQGCERKGRSDATTTSTRTRACMLVSRDSCVASHVLVLHFINRERDAESRKCSCDCEPNNERSGAYVRESQGTERRLRPGPTSRSGRKCASWCHRIAR